MGPLHGVRVIELEAIGPAPFCGMLLASMGAQVLRVTRKAGSAPPPADPLLAGEVLTQGRPALALDLKQPASVELLLGLVGRSDALIEGFRPGVMERLGLGPEPCLARNPRLVYGRMTGWGQHGPLAMEAGHDLNYIAIAGALHAIGAPDAPSIPLNLLGDFGGGGMLLAFGVVCALLEARGSGRGQVVDAAMSDGTALLMSFIYQLKARDGWQNRRGANTLDGGAPFYNTYACADGRWLAVAAIEAKFYANLLERCDLPAQPFAAQWDRARWPELRALMAERFRTKTRDEWCALLEGADCCVAPVLDLDEAPAHPHNQARGAFVTLDGAPHPAPAPQFSRTPAAFGASPTLEEALAAWELGEDELARLRAEGAL